MTKYAALHAWFCGLGALLSAGVYNLADVPDANEVSFPYLTYSYPVSPFSGGDDSADGEINLWCRTSSEAAVNAMCDKIAEYIGYGGSVVRHDGGYVWIRRGEPFCTPLGDPDDGAIRRRYFNISLSFLSVD